jgi:hypothetical protein
MSVEEGSGSVLVLLAVLIFLNRIWNRDRDRNHCLSIGDYINLNGTRTRAYTKLQLHRLFLLYIPTLTLSFLI